MALDKAARKFVLQVNEVDIKLNSQEGQDRIVVEVAGKIMPSTKKRLTKAIREGRIHLKEKEVM